MLADLGTLWRGQEGGLPGAEQEDQQLNRQDEINEVENRLNLARQQLEWQSNMTNEFYSGVDDYNDQESQVEDNFEGISAIGEEQQKQIRSEITE